MQAAVKDVRAEIERWMDALSSGARPRAAGVRGAHVRSRECTRVGPPEIDDAQIVFNEVNDLIGEGVQPSARARYRSCTPRAIRRLR